MRLGAWLALAARESRGSAGRLVFFVLCLSMGVAAVVAVAGLSQALDDGIQGQARQLLAADLAVKSRRPIPTKIFEAVDALEGARSLRTFEMPTVISTDSPEGSVEPGPSLLCELKAVESEYPFYGDLELRPDRPLEELLGSDEVLVGPELLSRLDLEVGSSIRIGQGIYSISGVVEREPDRLEVSFTLGPRLILSLEGLERSELLGLGSRISHRLLVQLPEVIEPDGLASAAERVREAIEDPALTTVETYTEAQPALRRGLERVESFLGLVALLSLLIGGIGVAQAVRAWINGRLHAIAILRALGVRPREVFGLYLIQTIVLALIGSGVGVVLGTAVAQWVPVLLEALLPVRVEVGWQWGAVLRGVGLGLGVALLFALRPLIDVGRVPPVRVLRQSAEPLPLGRSMALGLGVALGVGIAMTAAFQSGSILRGLGFAGGMVVVTAALTLGARLVMKLVSRTPRRGGSVIFRHGLAALARPGAGTLGAVVALGLGVVTVLAMHLVQDRLSNQLKADLPENAPSAFLVDIQTDQWPGVQSVLEGVEAASVDSVEVVMARLRRVAGVAVTDLVGEEAEPGSNEDENWAFTREQRLTTLETLPEDNVIVEGALWSIPDQPEISIEQDFAKDLGVGLGDTLVLDVQGVEFELIVSSIRTVDWGQFTINFFLVVEPGVLDGAPKFRIAAAQIPKDNENLLQDRLASKFPNITVLRIRELLEKLEAILKQVGFGVRFLGGFTVLAGILILAGAIGAQAIRRSREVALYKTLGMTRRQIVSVFAVEYGLVGLVAGAIGTVGGVVLAYLVTRFGMELPWAWNLPAVVLALVITVALSIAAGLMASVRALAVPPLAVFRQGE